MSSRGLRESLVVANPNASDYTVDVASSATTGGRGGSTYHGLVDDEREKTTNTATKNIRYYRIALITLLIVTLVCLSGILYYALRPKDNDNGNGGTLPPINPATALLADIGRDMDASRNLAINPCDDWYQYACGGWIKSTTLPANTSRITKGFDLAGINNNGYIDQVINNDWPLISPMYKSCMDISTIETLGYSPIMPLMQEFNPDTSKINSLNDLFSRFGQLRMQMQLSLVMTIGVANNPNDTQRYILTGGLGGLTLNDWSYYIGVNNTQPMIRSAISSMFQVIGDSVADANRYASWIVDFETQLVNITQRNRINQSMMNWEDRRAAIIAEEWDSLSNELTAENGFYNITNFTALAPHVPIMSYLNATGVFNIYANANITNPMIRINDADGYVLIDNLIANTPLPTLLAYARWHILNTSTPYLAAGLQQAYLEGFLTPLEGITALPDRHPQCRTLVVNDLSDLFGRYFMASYLPPAAQNQARELITWIRTSFELNLPSISWMDSYTRSVALDKAKAVLELVGGPDRRSWSDYSGVSINRYSYWMNMYAVRGLRTAEEFARLPTARNRAQWFMNPVLVNAAYSSTQNAMVFPAAILQSPFYNAEYPMAMNLGGIGMVMGHELLHGFDNNGRQYDKDGYRRQWWNDSVIYAFTNKTQCLISLYNNTVIQGTHINGQRTLGENIADNGGLKMAWMALQRHKAYLASHGLSDPIPPSANPLTTDQLFWYAAAQTWCTVATDQSIATQIRTDSHSPGQARVFVPAMNSPEFAAAFNCPVGSKMNPATKCDLY